MPIFEYKCQDCDTKFEVLHKSISNPEKVVCPNCSSENFKKLLSAFSASTSGSVDYAPSCAGGSCGVPSSPCAGGMCGLN